MTFQEFFEKDYKYRSKEQKIANAKYDYRTLQNNIGSMEAIQLVWKNRITLIQNESNRLIVVAPCNCSRIIY